MGKANEVSEGRVIIVPNLDPPLMQNVLEYTMEINFSSKVYSKSLLKGS